MSQLFSLLSINDSDEEILGGKKDEQSQLVTDYADYNG